MGMKPLAKIISEVGDNVLEGIEELRLPEPAVRCFLPNAEEEPCAACGGRGWYVVGGEPRKCENYDPQLDTLRQEDLITLSGLKDIGMKTFDTFNIEVSTKRREYTKPEQNALKKALVTAKAYAKDPKGWLVFEGAYGCGKTHLALSIATELIHSKGMSVRFVTVADLLDELRATFSGKGDTTGVVLAKYQSGSAVLILDDYGAEKNSEWAEEKLFQLLNYRHASNLATIITTNLSIAQMPARIGSRMQESSVVKYIKINAPDYRKATSKVKDAPKTNPMEAYSDMTFGNFNVANNRMETALKGVQRWAGNPSLKVCLYITGDYGVGKTHLAAAMGNQIHEDGGAVKFVRCRDLIQDMHSALDKDSEVKLRDLVRSYVDVPILILDDFSVSGLGKWAKENLFDILDSRLLQKRPIVITSVKPVSELEKRWRTRLQNESLCYELVVRGDQE